MLQVMQVKADMFSGFVTDVIKSVEATDPETAAALEKLHLAHRTLFRVHADPEAALSPVSQRPTFRNVSSDARQNRSAVTRARIPRQRPRPSADALPRTHSGARGEHCLW